MEDICPEYYLNRDGTGGFCTHSGDPMSKHKHRNKLSFAIAALFALAPLPTLAVGSPLNVRGTITSVDRDTINIKENNGSSAKIRLAKNAVIMFVTKATLSDIQPGSYIGTAATPRTDGKLQAIEIHIFPKSLRGAGEGNRAWDLAPKSSMTNGTVAQPSGPVADNKVNKVAGNSLTVDYHGGAKTVLITPSTKVVSLKLGNRSELKPGTQVFIVGASKNGDGSLKAGRITVGTKNLPPPM
jgi:Domain of unknown function (DUF5666)